MIPMKCQEQILKLNKDKTLLSYSVNDFYKKYKKERRDVRHLTQKQYRKAILKVFYYISQDIIETGIPYNPKVLIGRFGIVKRKSKNKVVDFKKTKEIGKTVYFTNLHTSGYYFRWFWEKFTSKCRFKNKRYYKFVRNRNLKKRLHKHIMKLSNDPYSKDYDCLSQLPIYEQS